MICAYLCFLLVFNFQPLRSRVAQFAEEQLSGFFETQVHLADIEVGLFNRLTLKDIHVCDQSGERLLTAKNISVKIQYADLLDGKVNLRTLLLLEPEINLYRAHEDSSMNVQFLIDKLSSKEKTESTDTRLRIGSLIITRGKLHYNEQWQPETPHKLNAAHLSIDSIHSNLSLRVLASDSINIRIRNFSGHEKAGFSIDKMSCNVLSSAEHFGIHNFKLLLPHTALNSPQLLLIDKPWNELSAAWRDAEVTGGLSIESLSAKDFSAFAPALEKLPLSVGGSIDIAYTNKELQAKLMLNEERQHAAAKMSAVAMLGDSLVESVAMRIEELSADSVLISDVLRCVGDSGMTVVSRLGNIQLAGDCKGNLQAQSFDAAITCKATHLGRIGIKAEYEGSEFRAALEGKKLNLAYIFDEAKLPNDLKLTATTRSNGLTLTPTSAEADITIEEAALPSHTLRDIRIQLSKKQSRYMMDIASRDTAVNGSLSFVANISHEAISNASLSCNMSNLNFSELGINDTILSGRWRSALQLDVPLWSKHEKEALLSIDSLSIERHENYFLEKLKLAFKHDENNDCYVALGSDFLDIEAKGAVDNQFKMDWLADGVYHHIPSLKKKSASDKHFMSLKVNAKRDDFFKKVLFLPVGWSNDVTMTGNFNMHQNYWELSANADSIEIDDDCIKDLRLYSIADNNQIRLLLQGEKQVMREDVRIELSASLESDTLLTNITWQDEQQNKFAGNVGATTLFSNVEGKLQSNTKIRNSQFVINKKLWEISNGNFTLSDNDVSIDSLMLTTMNTNDAERLTINGDFASNNDNTLQLYLQNFDVGYVLDLVNFDDVLFDGKANGTLTLSPNSSKPFLKANLLTKQFCFNNAALGDALINAEWKNTQMPISLSAHMIDTLYNAQTLVNGNVSPAGKSLDLQIDTKGMNLAFLNMWVKGIVDDLEGRATGNCRLYGSFKYLDLNGRVKADLATTIPANGVRYEIKEADIDISDGLFNLRHGEISDFHHGHGTLSATLRHKKLKKFSYNLDLNASSLRLYDISKNTSMPFYATANANGHVNLNGEPGRLSLNIDVAPTYGTMIVYTGQESTLYDDDKDDSLVKFRNKNDYASDVENQTTTPLAQKTTHTADMEFNIAVNMNPQATLRVIMDPATDSYIDLMGNGMLNAKYHNKGDFTLHGIYDIVGGVYKLSIENLLKKNFEIQPGSTINFTGNTDYSPIDLKAVYTVQSASIADLNIGDSFSDRNIPVNCILNIKGTPASPIVSFELDLPTVSDDEKQMVRNLISTEDDLNMQIIHLLSFGRFYTYDYRKMVTDAESQNQSTVMANSFISSTLSSQLNDLLTKMVDTNKWSIGTNVSTGTYGWDEMEVEGLLSGRLLNNRLQFNGNFGYRERKYSAPNDANFVGDFDISYLLTPSGTYSVKAYSQSNDRYFTKSSLTTQGIGIQYQKNFNKFKDIFQIFKRKK